MSSFISGTKEVIQRVPWKEYFFSLVYKLLGFLVIALLLIGCIIFSQSIDLTNITLGDPIFLITIALSSICYILVLVGFTKIILFDMANEFGLRDEKTGKIVFDAKFFLFAALIISFCSAIYTLLDVFLKEAYLQLLLFILTDWVLVTINVNIPGLTDKVGLEYYQTIRNIYFDTFFLVIIGFSVLVFLAILTTLARMRIQNRFKDEETYEEEEEKSWFLKFLLWIAIPPMSAIFIVSQNNLLANPVYRFMTPFLFIILLVFIIWWLYQIIKAIFKILRKGVEITAFLTSVNFLLIFPLVFVFYIFPVLLWTGWDVLLAITANPSFDISQILNHSWYVLTQVRWYDIQSIFYLDFVFITIIATLIVGFAEGFAVLAIFSAISRGVAVARTGRIIARSPPKVMVISKYLLLLAVWLSLVWENFRGIWEMLVIELQIALPDITIPRLFYTIYEGIITPLSEWVAVYWPIFKDIPFLILPLYFILAASFKFLSVTLVTPLVKDRLLTFFLLISTAFVLIITQVLGDIYDPNMNIPDAPLIQFAPVLTYAVQVFTYVEAIAFYAGFLFGLFWLIRRTILSLIETPDEIASEAVSETVTEKISEVDSETVIEKVSEVDSETVIETDSEIDTEKLIPEDETREPD
ncbi:MAG: hypothetical protein ACXAEU_13630 [Candidatus Hodarchaeales archaeon]|jgi:hypothetical protein